MFKKPWLLLAGFAIVAVVVIVAALALLGGDDEKPKAVACAPAAPTFAADSTMGKIVAAKKITFGVKFDQPGFGVKDAVSGKLDGFDIAIAKEIGKSLCITDAQMVFEEAISKNRVPYLQEDKVDVVIAPIISIHYR